MKALQYFVATLFCTAIAGCSNHLGLHFGQDSVQNQQENSAIASDDPPPAGKITTITPRFLQQQAARARSLLDPQVKGLLGTHKAYSIGAGDVVSITVWGHPELALPVTTQTTDPTGQVAVGNGYNVSAQGRIQFPLIGSVPVAGMTEEQVRVEISNRLSKYLKNPQVTVRVQAYRSARVYLDGEVRTPGLQAINDVPVTLLEAINRAGGFSPNADRAALVLTRGKARIPLNLYQLSEQGVNPGRIQMQAGDLLHVGSRDDSKVYVLGEVGRPGAQTFKNGRLTLNDALGEAAGVTAFSNPSQIYVVRNKPVTEVPKDTAAYDPEIFHLDASTAASYALAARFDLQPHDVVYVDPALLVRWNRVINLILPNVQALTAGKNLTD